MQLLGLGAVDAGAPRLHGFGWCPPAHPHHDRPRHDGVGQVVEAGQGDRTVRWQFLGLNDLAADDAAARDGSLAVAGVDHAANFLVFFSFRAKQGVTLVVQDGRPPDRIGHPTEQVGRCAVDGMHRPGH
ncbi:Uncharacterised protein [Mycobacterium tuberculosis]|nr:Uncharacterised protein [Mycobacterium tuberculosis]COX86264.1 Uncharacterised protein [Mycobacterium tuberculosis]